MMNNTNYITLIVSTTIKISLALLGYLITYLNNLRLSERKDRLDRLNRQLSEFYGPLFALDHAGYIARQKFLQEYAAGRTRFFAQGIKHSKEDLRIWRQWMKTVFMPINVNIYELILSKSDLLVESNMPSCLILLCAHVASYKVILEKWEQGDFSQHIALVGFPKDLHDYAERSFVALKTEQAKLLGKKQLSKANLDSSLLGG